MVSERQVGTHTQQTWDVDHHRHHHAAVRRDLDGGRVRVEQEERVELVVPAVERDGGHAVELVCAYMYIDAKADQQWLTNKGNIAAGPTPTFCGTTSSPAVIS